MFASLKNKIKEETGTDPAGAANQQRLHNNNNRIRSRFSSTISINSNQDELSGQSNNESEYLVTLRSQCNELFSKVNELQTRVQTLQDEKLRIERTNEILLESVKVAQTQKDLYCAEQEEIQNLQQAEIEKLKNLISFREQEAMDRSAALKQNQNQIENLTAELERLKMFEPMVEDLQDELERLRHASQLGKNNLTATLAATEEENRHLKMRLKIVDQVRLETIATLNSDEKLQALVQERKLLEQHLEEAHLQLSDIKSTWSGQNLALETQVSRLSKQVAEETTEKRKALKERDDLIEKIKQLEFEISNIKEEMKLKDNKISLLEEDIDDLNVTLKECREENEHQVLFERNKVRTIETENNELKKRIEVADGKFIECASNVETVTNALRLQITQIQQRLHETQAQLEQEKEEKLTALLKNAEISQSEEILKKELRLERDEIVELHEKCTKLEDNLKAKELDLADSKLKLEEKLVETSKNEHLLNQIDELRFELDDKYKTIKILNQRLADLKKTVQREFRNTKTGDAGAVDSLHFVENANALNNIAIIKPTTPKDENLPSIAIQDGHIIMDEVNFKYLKHVIVKFLTSREVEARHLIRAVATLLKLTKEEEKLLHDTLNWKMSWFGTKPYHGSGQRSFSIPPS